MSLSLFLLAPACADDGKSTSVGSSETGDGDGDNTAGDGDGTPGDGDGVPGDGDGVPGDGDGVPGDGDGVPGDGDGVPGDGDGVPGDGDGVPGDGDGDGAPSCSGEPVLVCDVEPPSDPFVVNNVTIVGDCLELDVSYSGGCETHTYSPCWDMSFAESNPVQAWLWIDHDAMNDPCDAFPQDLWIVDLSALKLAWQNAYQAQSGTITLHVAGETIAYDF